jgi:hypothetical protein
MMPPAEKLDAKVVAMQVLVPVQFLESLLPVRRGWFANPAVQGTAAAPSSSNRLASWPPPLSYVGSFGKEGVFP